jgi:signal peptidase I
MLGDNRDNSTDSRFAASAGGLGFVPMDSITGRVDRVLFSVAGSAIWQIWTIRANRFLQGVQ